MTRIFDNIELRLGEHLQATLKAFNRMDVAVGYFNLRGWSEFNEIVAAKEPADEPLVRILIGMVFAGPEEETLDQLQATVDGQPRPDADSQISKERKAQLLEHLRVQLMRGAPTAADRKTLAALREHLGSGKVAVKVFTRRPLHGKTFIFHRDDLNSPIMGFVGSSNLTAPGLNSNLELNVDVPDSFGGGKDLADWFDARWDDPHSRMVTADLLALLDESWASVDPKPPYEVFLKLCYDLSRDVREGQDEYSVPLEVQSELLDYQATAVRTLARRIVTRGGTMLGDVVGLGKTITAVAVSLMLREEHGYLPLVVCPKNLKQMWEEYFDAYDVPGRVVSYTEAHNVLPTISRYRFVIVDESHTLRNDKRRDYQAVLEYLERVGAKALLLTATPYNRRFEDVANQLGLFIQPDEDLGISPVNALAADPKLADRVDGKITTLQAFKRSEDPDDWKRLMSEHLVRRTRTFIKNNYSESDDDGSKYLRFADGTKFRFPERVARPIDHPFAEGDPAALMASDDTLNALQNLVLPRYSLIEYVDEKRKSEWSDEDKQIVENLRRARGQVAGFVRTTLYKRLSSGGYAFTLSLRRHVARNELFLFAIDNGLPLPTGTIQEADLLDDDDIIEHDVDDTERLGDAAAKRYQALADAAPGYVTWVRSELFTPALREALRVDSEALSDLLAAYGPWEIGRDSKLTALADLITNEHPNDKILVFTEYKDTANYVADALRSMGIESVDAATGDDEDPTQLARRFSPHSNKLRGNGSGDLATDELRVLISTDVLSEGQNLQDAHVVVNYDLPWAIVRLIQRAGRVDRVGQESSQVLLYSIFHGSLNNVLSLRQRIADRLHQNAQAFGSDEQFFGSEDEVRTINDLYNGTLDEAEDVEDIDAASLAYQYWSNALEQTPEAAERARRLPDLVDATRTKRITDIEDGVACYVRTEAGVDGFGWITPAGETRLLTGFETLRVFECSPGEPSTARLPNHDEMVSELVRGPLANPAVAAGRLRGVRRQIWKRLGESLFDFGADASAALDLLYQHPLTNEADRRLRNAIRNGATDEELANRLAALAREDKLVIERRSGNDSIRIVSTMGVN
ncbi:ATP-dependent RNA helicase DbpA [Microbacterium azadirachtae]|uniref:ATP-dependent RNA helicase DbpA n=1 Tax=Microbacterium azadirachtae TaxID=582680 RepID=A0A0F0KXQ8_9MICO|nr:helicase-related protein [Microbacterium azadirachtae]KJL24880.1 ATP-dependent RNA helicase DbpA [Microbacterium azadirachtae]